MKKYEIKCNYLENNILAIDTAHRIVEYLNDKEYDNLEQAIFEEVDRELIYYDDQWKLMRSYQRPCEANYHEAVEMYINEIFSIIHEEELEEELDEEMDEER